MCSTRFVPRHSWHLAPRLIAHTQTSVVDLNERVEVRKGVEAVGDQHRSRAPPRVVCGSQRGARLRPDARPRHAGLLHEPVVPA